MGYPPWFRHAHSMAPQECLDKFMSCKTLFYGGSGSDESPIWFLLEQYLHHEPSARCFIYVDYHYVDNNFHEPHRADFLEGFTATEPISLETTDLFERYACSNNVIRRRYPNCPDIYPKGFIQLFRSPTGAMIAVMFLDADAHVAFDALYGDKPKRKPPFVFVIHDHGFGGDWGGRFGRGGVCNTIANEKGITPDYLFVNEHSDPWFGYINDLSSNGSPKGFRGGEHQGMRWIFKKR